MTIASVSSSTAITQLYEGLSSDTKPTQGVQAYALFKETDTSNVYEFSGTTWNKTSTGGADHVHTEGGAGIGMPQSHETAAGDLNNTNVIEFIFPDEIGPTLIRARLIDCTNKTSTLALVSGSTNVGQATGRLGAPGAINTATQRRLIKPESDNLGNSLIQIENVFPFDAAITRIHVQMNSADPTAILLLEAV